MKRQGEIYEDDDKDDNGSSAMDEEEPFESHCIVSYAHLNTYSSSLMILAWDHLLCTFAPSLAIFFVPREVTFLYLSGRCRWPTIPYLANCPLAFRSTQRTPYVGIISSISELFKVDLLCSSSPVQPPLPDTWSSEQGRVGEEWFG